MTKDCTRGMPERHDAAHIGIWVHPVSGLGRSLQLHRQQPGIMRVHRLVSQEQPLAALPACRHEQPCVIERSSFRDVSVVERRGEDEAVPRSNNRLDNDMRHSHARMQASCMLQYMKRGVR